MFMATTLATFVSKIGFEVDQSSLKKIDSVFATLQKKVQSLQSSMKTPLDRMQSRVQLEGERAKLLNKQLNNQALKNQIDLSKNQVENQRRQSSLLAAQERHQMFLQKSQARLQNSQARVTELAQRAVTKSTPSAGRVGAMSEGGRGRIGMGSGGLFGGVSMGAGLGTVAGLEGARRFIAKAFTVGNFQTSQMPQYEFLTGNKEDAGKQVEYVNNLVDKLKLNLVDTNQAYVQFLGATQSTVGNEKTQEIFTNLRSFGVMMGASGDQLKRGTKAVQQMLSKQKLSAEELECRLAA